MKQVYKNLSIVIAFLLAVALTIGLTACLADNTPKTETTRAEKRAVLRLAGETDEVVVNSSVVATVLETHSLGSPITFAGSSTQWYAVRTASDLAYVLRFGGGGNYLLQNNFVITDNDWFSRHPVGGVRGDSFTGVLSGARYVNGQVDNTLMPYGIRLSVSQMQEAPSYHKYTGLYGRLGGTLQDMTFVFDGTAFIDGSNGTINPDKTYYVGALAGSFSGVLKRCIISYSGAITAYANANERNIYIGGLFGEMNGGRIEDCDITILGSINLQNKLLEDADNKEKLGLKCRLYAGGLVGNAQNNDAIVPTITGTTINAMGSIMVSDTLSKNLGESIIDNAFFNTIRGWFGNDALEPNGDGYVFPASAIVAGASSISISNSTLKAGGSASSIGGDFASKVGSIAGGVIGYAPTSANLLIANNAITLSTALNGENISNKNSSLQGQVFRGGLVGRFEGAVGATARLLNNVVTLDLVLEPIADINKAKGGSFYGYLAGNGAQGNLSGWKGNGSMLWIISRGTPSVRATTDNSGNASDIATGKVAVVGGGDVVSAVDSTGHITMRAVPQNSPFYGWKTSIENNREYKTSEITLQNGVPTFTPSTTEAITVYATFLTREIKNPGTLVSWANDMNAGLNQAWVNTTVTADFDVAGGAPIVQQYRGTFNGNNHTITYLNSVYRTAETNVGIFGTLTSTARVENLKLVFAGHFTATGLLSHPEIEGSTDTTALVGILAAANAGTIDNVSLTMLQAGSVSATSTTTTIAGGLVGINSGSISNVSLTLDGTFDARGGSVIMGGITGNSTAASYTGINADISGTMAGYIDQASGSIYAGGLMGNSGLNPEQTLSLNNVVVNINERSLAAGDVFTTMCSHTLLYQKDLLDSVVHLHLGYANLIDDLNKAKTVLGLIGVAGGEEEAKRILLQNVQNAIDMSATGTLTNAWLNNNIVLPANLLKCATACVACASRNAGSYFVGKLNNNVSCNQVWAVGSYKQYPTEAVVADAGLGTMQISYFGDRDTAGNVLQGLADLHVNMIFVQGGRAVATQTATAGSYSVSFSIPDVDSSHVFTGWYEDKDLTTMVDRGKVVGGVFTPGNAQGRNYYSKIISNRIVTADDLSVVAQTTNAGQAYEGVTFTIGSDLLGINDYVPIGHSESNPFAGRINGGGYTVSITTFASESECYGFVGHLATQGSVSNIRLEVPTQIALVDDVSKVFGGLVAVNNGTVGDNTHNNPITVRYANSISGPHYVGGVVGENYGTVQNVQAEYAYRAGLSVGLSAHTNSSLDASVGGIVAYNAPGATIKNAQVCTLFEGANTSENAPVSLKVDNVVEPYKGYAGGLVGYNKGNIYSGVVSLVAEGLVANRNATQGVMVGYNEHGDLDSLWTVYNLRKSDYSVPNLNENATSLVNGTDASVGNRLVRYGKKSSSIEATIFSALTPKGGTITFHSVEGSAAVPFYGFTQSMEHGEDVPGSGGQHYSPQVAREVAHQIEAGVHGKTYYGVFAKSSITNEADFLGFVAHINSGFEAFVRYTLNLTGTTLEISTSRVGYDAVGAATPFVGSFDGGSKTIQVRGNNAKPLFGIVGEHSSITNFVFVIEEEVQYFDATEYDGHKAMGALTALNYGTVKSVSISSTASLYGDADTSVGYVAGYNNGHIENCRLALDSSTISGMAEASELYGGYVGNFAGYNDVDGVIGAEGISNTIVNMMSGNNPSKVIGVYTAGGIAGTNRGLIRNVAIQANGVIGSPDVHAESGKFYMGINSSEVDVYISYYAQGVAGMIAGENQGVVGYQGGVVDTAIVEASATSVLRATGTVGGMVGVNSGRITAGDADNSIQLRGSVSAAIVGGVVGNNQKDIEKVSIRIYQPLTAIRSVGGLVGDNSGRLQWSSVEVDAGATLTCSDAVNSQAGGLVGINRNNGTLYAVHGDISAVVGGTSTYNAGGMVGNSIGKVEDSYVRVFVAPRGAKPGLGMGISSGDTVINSWAIASNSITLSATSNGYGDVNTLKVVGTEMVVVHYEEEDDENILIFTAPQTSSRSLYWYSDISNWYHNEQDEQTYVGGNRFEVDATLTRQTFHLCYYKLGIDSVEDLAEMATNVNAGDLFYDVCFVLTRDLVMGTDVQVQPVGNEKNAFTGIFDGCNHTITFNEGSGIAGSTYSGLFGNVGGTATIRNLIIDIKEDVYIGSSSRYVGVLAGAVANDASVSNVGINLRSAPNSIDHSAEVGALFGHGNPSNMTNVWVVIYNSNANLLGTSGASDANVMALLGDGVVSISFNEQELQLGNHVFELAVIEGNSGFDNLYLHVNPPIVWREADRATVGSFNDVTLVYKPLPSLTGSNYTMSFISFVIHNSAEFAQFAHHVNKFGDNGAVFTFDLEGDEEYLVVNLDEFQPIGTREHPFSGTLDGYVGGIGHTCAITLKVIGNVEKDADYCGLFGYVAESAVIRNLIVEADESKTQTIGYTGASYTGFLAGAFHGTLKNVVVKLTDKTQLVHIREDAKGGIAGLFGATAKSVNSWLILPENSPISVCGTAHADIPAMLQQCGQGMVYLSVKERRDGANNLIVDDPSLVVAGEPLGGNVKMSITFTQGQSSAEEPVYGFIDSNAAEPTKESSLVSTDANEYAGKEMLAVFINNTISNEQELRHLATILNQEGRSYLGIPFIVTNDITISGEWTPIGGEVETYTGSGEYKQVPFVGSIEGIYNGSNQHYATITFDVNSTCGAHFAGLFGLLADTARVKNLIINANGSMGNADTTQYAGVLAGVDKGATLENIIINVGKEASLNANMDSSRVAVGQAITPKEAENVWVLCYNNRYNVEQNKREQRYYDSLGEEGVFNGGANIITVVAAGNVSMSFLLNGAKEIEGTQLYGDVAKIKTWYTLSETGEQSTYRSDLSTNAYLDMSEKGAITYISFLHTAIGTVEAWKDLQESTNAGYDLYGLVFTLDCDIVLDSHTYGSTQYIPLGAIGNPFNATLDGRCDIGAHTHEGDVHTITLAEEMTAVGEYAGIVGYLGVDGVLRNIKMVGQGTIGNAETQYAGMVAYSEGKVQNVAMDATQLTIACNAYAGAAFGYDGNQNTNVWVVTNAANAMGIRSTSYTAQGVAEPKVSGLVLGGLQSSVNSMRVVGTGYLHMYIEEQVRIVGGTQVKEYYITMATSEADEGNYAVRGWYSDYSRDNQLSDALGVSSLYSQIKAGDNAYYQTALDLLGKRYEVVIMDTIISTERELLLLADDINKSGYDFANTTFTLSADIVIQDPSFVSIGGTSPFRGTLSGMHNNQRHSITLDIVKDGMHTALPLFGTNDGIVENLVVVLNAPISLSAQTAGVLASQNTGTIRGCLVVVKASANANILGGVAGQNSGNVENCLVYIAEGMILQARESIGGLVGYNIGNVLGSNIAQINVWRSYAISYLAEWSNYYATSHHQVSSGVNYASVMLDGTLAVDGSLDKKPVAVGGAVGLSEVRGASASINGVTVRVGTSGIIKGKGDNNRSNMVSMGGLVGKSLASISNCVVLADGRLVVDSGTYSYDGYFGGDIQSAASNSWLVVPVPPVVKVVANGVDANLLKVAGNGLIDAHVDQQNNIIFENITDETGSALDGWYIDNGIAVPEGLGNVSGDSFRPNVRNTAQIINVVFINTDISTVADLIDMANTVNAGLFASYLEFRLQNDIVIDASNPFSTTIGYKSETASSAFKHIFDGNGYTITIRAQVGESVFGSADYINMGLFGYTTQSAVIKNLSIVVEGPETSGISVTYGNSNTLSFGMLVGENNGTIENCHVYIAAKKVAGDIVASQGGVAFTGKDVGGLVGANMTYGSIRNASVTNYGVLKAYVNPEGLHAEESLHAGGMVGVNSGTMTDVKVWHRSGVNGVSLQAEQSDKASSYVGGLSGTNSGSIVGAEAGIYRTRFVALDALSAYAGGLVGTNTGNVENVYVFADKDSGIDAGRGAQGGLIGSNSNEAYNMLLELAHTDAGNKVFAKGDAAVGAEGTNSMLRNVWVYNTHERFNSMRPDVNNMTVTDMASTPSVVHNDKEQIVSNGTIAFYAVIDIDAGMTVWADAHTSFATVLLSTMVHKGVEVPVLMRGNGTSLVLDTDSTTCGISVKPVIRRGLSDQSELKYMAWVLANDIQAITDEYTLEADIEITGAYTAIPGFAGSFDGRYHSITFVEDSVSFVDAPALMTGTKGTLHNLVIHHYHQSIMDTAEASAYPVGVVAENDGAMDNVVVYVEKGAVLSEEVASVLPSASVSYSNVWVITRTPEENNSSTYKVIVIDGAGDILVTPTLDGELRFTAVPQADSKYSNTFAGYSISENETGRTMLTDGGIQGNELDTMHDNLSVYGVFYAEFLSTYLDTEERLNIFLSLLNMGYVASGSTYTMGADLEVDASALRVLAKFEGVLNGGFYTLTLRDNLVAPEDGETIPLLGEQSASLEERTPATIKNIAIDLRGIHTEGVVLLSENSSYYLNKVLIYNDDEQVYLTNGIDLDVDSTISMEAVYVASINRVAYDAHAFTQGCGFLLYSDTTSVTLTATDNNEPMRVQAACQTGTYFGGWYTAEAGAPVSGGQHAISLTAPSYFLRTIDSVVATDAQVQAFMAMLAQGFTMEGYEFVLDADLVLVNQRLGVFRGVLRGNGHTVTLADTLFDEFHGAMYDVIIRTSATTAIADKMSISAILDNVVVFGTENAKIANNTSGTLRGTWLIGVNPSSYNGLNRIDGDAGKVSVDKQAEGYVFTLLADNKYLLLTDAQGNVVHNEQYNIIRGAGKDAYYKVQYADSIGNEEQLAVYAVAVAHGFTGNVKLINDLVINQAFDGLSGLVRMDGQGKTIRIASENVTLFASLAAQSMVLNLMVEVDEQVASFVLQGETAGEFANMVVSINGDTSLSMADASVNNVWVLHQAAICEDMAGSYTLPADVKVLRYQLGQVSAAMQLNGVSHQYEIHFGASYNDSAYFLGYYAEGVLVSVDPNWVASSAYNYVQSVYVDATIANDVQWQYLAAAMRVANADLNGKTFAILSDIALTNGEQLTGFNGTIAGNGHTITLDGQIPQGGVVQAGTSASVNDVLFEVAQTASLQEGDWLTSGEVYNTWIVSYQPFAYAHGARLLVVDASADSNARMQAVYVGGTFRFSPVDQSEYRLHYYRVGADEYEKVGDDEYIKGAVSYSYEDIFAAATTIVAEFDNCYTVYVEVDGIDASRVTADKLSTTKAYWVSGTHTATVEFKYAVDGYVFVGFTLLSDREYTLKGTDVPAYVTSNEYRRVSLDVSASKSVVVTAHYQRVTSEWKEQMYGAMTEQELKDYLTLPESIRAALPAGYQVSTIYSYDANVLVDEEQLIPVKHAGNYGVQFIIKDADGEEIGRSVGLSFNITPRPLHVSALSIKPKPYDGDTKAVIESIQFAGFVEGAGDKLNKDNIILHYYDGAKGTVTADAGSWQILMDARSALSESLLSSGNFHATDYQLPLGEVLYTYSNGVKTETPFTGSIVKQVIKLTIKDFSISYLEQFGKAFDISAYLNGSYDDSKLSEADKEVLRNNSLLLVEGDEIENNEYFYNIKQVGTYYIRTISRGLSNFEAELNQNVVRMTVTASAIVPTVAQTSMVYGSKSPAVQMMIAGKEEWFTESYYHELLANGNTKFLNIGSYAEYLKKLSPKAEAVAAVAGGTDVAFAEAMVGEQYGIKVLYTIAQNAGYVVAPSAGYVPYQDNNLVTLGYYISLTSATTLLSVTPRSLTYEVTSGAAKAFGAPDERFTGRATAGTVAFGDSLTFVRASGELVGSYAISPVIMRGGADVTSNYTLTPHRAEGYSYEITKRTLRISLADSGKYYYGSTQQTKSMPILLSADKETIARMNSILGITGKNSLNTIITLYAKKQNGKLLGVGSYTADELEREVNTSFRHIENQLDLVIDTRTRFSIVPAVLTVTTKDFSRVYDGTSNITFGDKKPENYISVTGWAGDEGKLFNVSAVVNSTIGSSDGIYSYQLSAVFEAKKKSDAGILENYDIQNVAGKYTIKKLTVRGLSAMGGYYDQEGMFTFFSSVQFGDESAAWNYAIDDISTLPQAMQDRIAELIGDVESVSDKAMSDALAAVLHLEADAISSLAVGLSVGSDYYPRTTDRSIECMTGKNTMYVDVSESFDIYEAQYVIKDIVLTASEKGDEPVLNFVIAIGNKEIVVENVVPGVVHAVTDSFAVRFALGDSRIDSADYSIQSFVNTGDAWARYDDVSNPAVLFVAQGDTIVAASEMATSAIKYDDTFVDMLRNLWNNNMLLILGGVAGFALLIALLIVVPRKVAKGKRASKAAERYIRHENILDKVSEEQEAENNDAIDEE